MSEKQMGYRRIYSDSTGNLTAGSEVVFGNSNHIPFGDTKMEYEDFGLELVEDDLGAMDYASLGAMDYASLGEDDYDDFGARKRAARRRRAYRRRGRSRLQRPKSARATQVVQKTLLTANSQAQPGGPGAAFTLVIRPQFDFVAEDLTMATRQPNNPAGFGIQAIEFGDRIIFNNAQSVPLAVFATGSFVRGLVKGAAIAAGLDISLSCTAANSTTASQLTVVFTGLKRGTTGCGPGAV